MITVVISKQNFMDAYDVYAEVLQRFIKQFTPDEARVCKILDAAIWAILNEAARQVMGTNLGPLHHLIPFAHMLRITRQTALKYLREDPLYDEWAPFTLEPHFFPLMTPPLTEFHQQVFYLRYYRDISEAAIAERYKTTEGNVKIKLRETLKAMFATMKAGA